MNDKTEVRLEDLPADERTKVMQAAREYVTTTRIAQAQEASAKKRRRKPGRLHKPGSNWYELEAYFDPARIEATPIADSGFMMGVLEDMVVVEVEENCSHERIYALGQKLSEMGIKALVVQRGIRFLRLRSCDAEQAKRLDEILLKHQQPAEDADEQGSEDTGASPAGDDSSE